MLPTVSKIVNNAQSRFSNHLAAIDNHNIANPFESYRQKFMESFWKQQRNQQQDDTKSEDGPDKKKQKLAENTSTKVFDQDQKVSAINEPIGRRRDKIELPVKNVQIPLEKTKSVSDSKAGKALMDQAGPAIKRKKKKDEPLRVTLLRFLHWKNQMQHLHKREIPALISFDKKEHLATNELKLKKINDGVQVLTINDFSRIFAIPFAKYHIFAPKDYVQTLIGISGSFGLFKIRTNGSIERVSKVTAEAKIIIAKGVTVAAWNDGDDLSTAVFSVSSCTNEKYNSMKL